MLPKGCIIVTTPDHTTVECGTEGETRDAKALANLWFSWHLAAIVVVTGGLLWGLFVIENRRTEYQHLEEREVESVFKIVEDLEHGNGESPHGGGSQHSMEMETLDGLDLER